MVGLNSIPMSWHYSISRPLLDDRNGRTPRLYEKSELKRVVVKRLELGLDGDKSRGARLRVH